MSHSHMYGALLPGGEEDSPTLPSQHGTHDDHNPPPLSLAPPPAGEFPSRDALMDYLKEWGKSQGYAVVIGRSRINRLWIKCDRGGEYADKHLNDPENRKRKRKASRLTGCPFGVKASMKKDQIWRCHTENGQHNHPASEDLSVHPSIRRMNEEQLAKVNEMTEAGKTPVETLDELKKIWPEIQVLKRDIYNARKKYKTEKELREVEEGLNMPQTFEDPNGRMPGPTRTGRWEWLEEGDEVKRKKKKAKSNSAALDSSTPGLDTHDDEDSPPQLPTMGLPSQPARRSASTIPNLPSQYHAPGLSPQPSTLQLGGREFDSGMGFSTSSPRPFRHYQTPNPQAMAQRSYAPNTLASNTDPMLQSTIPTRGQQPNLAGMASGMTPMMQSATTAPPTSMPGPTAAKPAQSGQVLMSRIERMEKEQNEQKNMLAQILSAVQGVGGSMRRGLPG